MFLKIIKYFLIIVLSASNSIAENTSFTGEFVQGGVVIGKNSSARKVIFDNQKLELSEDGYFIFGFGRNHKKSSSLKIIYDNKTKLYNFNIKKSHYKIEKIDGLAPKMVEPGPEFYKKIKADRILINNAMRNNFLNKKFPISFIKPAEGRLSGVYGSQRILNGVKKNPHGGMDIAAPVGTPIKTTSDGKVLLAEKGLYYTGNIVIIDHGAGFSTVYAHIEKIIVNENDYIEMGNHFAVVATPDKDSNAKLHFEVWGNKKKLNPQKWLVSR